MVRTPAKYLTVVPLRAGCGPMPFEMQPIVRLADNSVFGYELLYRGAQVSKWRHVDVAVLDHLGSCREELPTLFVNLDNETVIHEDIELFARAARGKRVYFELSEAVSNQNIATLLASRVNLMSQEGLKFAIDDFGAGLDGFRRLFALDKIAIIKIDGWLIRTAQKRPAHAEMLRNLVKVWRTGGILTVAECIEDRGMLDFARDMQVDMVQGFFVDALQAQPFEVTEATSSQRLARVAA